MIIQPYTHRLVLAQNKPGFARSAGLHLSHIYGSLYRKLEPKRFDRRDPATGEREPMALSKMELGMAFEEALEESLRQRILGDRPDEFLTKEGIAYSPDGLSFSDDGGHMILDEFKCTWMSSRGLPEDDTTVVNAFPEKFDYWFTQMKGYCHNLGTAHARLWVFFVCGDYNRPYTPELRAWNITFTAMELRENWSLLINHAKEEGML